MTCDMQQFVDHSYISKSSYLQLNATGNALFYPSQLFLCSSQYTSSDQWQLHGHKTEDWGQVEVSVVMTFSPNQFVHLMVSLFTVVYFILVDVSLVISISANDCQD